MFTSTAFVRVASTLFALSALAAQKTNVTRDCVGIGVLQVR